MNTVDKPWGNYIDLFRSTSVVLKILTIDPHEEISYQYHHKRTEFWYVQEGMGVLFRNETKELLTEGKGVIINKTERHQIKNESDKPLVIYEMQCGVCEEDDIVRISDKYERE